MPYTELPVTDPVPPNTRIRRYLSVAKLVSLLATKSLYFAPTSELGDRFEGTLPPNFDATAADPLDAAEASRREEGVELAGALVARARVNCWHEEEVESDALWRVYGPKEEMLAIRSDTDRLRRVAENSEQQIAICKVRYIDFETWQPDQLDKPTFYPHAYKRLCFAHEREVRAIIGPYLLDGELVGGGPGQGLALRPPIPPASGLQVRVELSDLITEVVVSPYANAWFLKAVQALVGSLGLAVPVEFSPLR